MTEEDINLLEEASEQRHQASLKTRREAYHAMKREFPARWRAIAAQKSAYQKRVYWDLKENRPEEWAEMRRRFDATHETAERKAHRAATYAENVRNDTFRCETCEMSFGSAGNLGKHLASGDHKARVDGTYVPPKTQDGDLSWWCDLCDRGWVEEYDLIKHERRSYGHQIKFAERNGLPPPPKPERLQCPHCPKTYADESGWRNHLKNKHPDAAALQAVNVQVFTCDVCPGETWDKMTQRDAHQRKSHLHAINAAAAAGLPPPADPPFFCGVCGFVYKNRVCLNKHKNKEQHHT
ncbi:hypothetical protein QR685DRAFT_319263 [Neurospora intermedia]|uniref:C2H2-type domain-containing protein n=1 Tax=Neurospora intermedia TaxID=5142 RepID=A0ABR3DAW2_NEUIN